jgi:probable addiction module antidote protein
MTTEYALFDASSYLDSEEMIAEYLTAAAEDENPDVMLLAIANVAKARGMTHVAKAAGLSRESLYKTLAPGAHPRFRTVQAILRALNVRLSLHAPPSSMKLGKAGRKTKSDEAVVVQKAATTKRYRATKKAAAKRPAPAKKRA